MTCSFEVVSNFLWILYERICRSGIQWPKVLFNVEFTQFSHTFEEFYGGRINNVRLRRDIGNEFYHILDLNSDVLLRQPMAIGPYLEEVLYNPVAEDHLLFNFCFERGYLCQKCQSIDRRIAVINRNLY